jgi:hypothetical protein
MAEFRANEAFALNNFEQFEIVENLSKEKVKLP